MSKDKCCGNCMHFKDEDVSGKGWCEEQSWVTECSKVCKCHEPDLNGWTEITPDNVDEVRNNEKNAVIMHPKEWNAPEIVCFITAENLSFYSRWGGYYYYVLPKLKLEESK